MSTTTRPGITHQYRNGITYTVRVAGREYNAMAYAVNGGMYGVSVEGTDNARIASRVARYVLADQVGAGATFRVARVAGSAWDRGYAAAPINFEIRDLVF